MSSYRYIVVEGVIGVGKTTLAELLSKDFDARLYLEIVEENPFLVKGFYDDMDAHAFNVEIFFLLSRFRQQQELTRNLLHTSRFLISDYLFAKNRIFAGQNLEGGELELFDSVYRPLNKKAAIPDLIIYLKADVANLMRRIQLRDRSFERSMGADYIEAMVERYDAFFNAYDETEVLTIDAATMDFAFNFKTYSKIKQLISEKIRKKTKPGSPAMTLIQKERRERSL